MKKKKDSAQSASDRSLKARVYRERASIFGTERTDLIYAVSIAVHSSGEDCFIVANPESVH